MSLPHNGSTAPVVTSPLLAWPARPAARSSPLPTPSTDAFDDLPSSYPSSSRQANTSTAVSNGERRWSSPKGKERAPETPRLLVFEHDGNQEVEQKERNYGPPRKPLPPHQLGRIAQSFGVIIPHLPRDPNLTSSIPQRPRSPASASSPTSTTKSRSTPHLATHGPTRPSPFLLSVIPPTSLLPPTSAATPEQAHKRIKKWRRGRLLPLQPTLGSMLVCIAREYGLPSTIGIAVYLVLPTSLSRGVGSSSSAASSYSSEGEEPNGPQVSSSIWSTLFSAHLINATTAGVASRASSPSHTPVKEAGHAGSIMPYPPSPSPEALKTSTSQPTSLGHRPKLRSLSTEPLSKLSNVSHSAQPSEASSLAILPPTPASLGTSYSASSLSPNPIVGTIEFDIDLDEATWYEDWQRSGGASRHQRSLVNEGGIKELSLVNKMADERPRFLKDLDVNRPSPERKRASVRNPEKHPVSASASFDRFTETDDTTLEGEDNKDDMDTLAPEDLRADDLLASPINLAPEDEERALDVATTLAVQEIMQKRGSGLVMAEQLEDLEKIMRQLSPRDIRLTSPRLLTPRMAAKVANLALPAVPRRTTSRTAPSPLAGGFTSPNPAELDREREFEVDSSAPNSATGSTHTFGSTLPHEQTDVDDVPEPEGADGSEETYEAPKPSWPAVPFRSPNSPSSVQEFFVRPTPGQRNVSSPASVSTETMRRMQAEATNAIKPVSSEWIPRRPARPPSPKLEHQRTLSHTLSPDLVDLLHRSPPASSPGNAVLQSPGGVASPEQKPRRSGSISLKGLRHQMSSKNLSHMWKNDTASRPVPGAVAGGREKETVGLFKGGEGEMSSSFTGPVKEQAHGHGLGFGFGHAHGQRSVSNPNPTPTSGSGTGTDFGPPLRSDDQDEFSPASATTGSLPSKSGGKLASRIFGFRKHDSGVNEKPHDREKEREKEKRSKRHPSSDTTHSTLNISSPIASSFVHNQASFGATPTPSTSANTIPELATLPHHQSQQAALGHGRMPSYGQPGSPHLHGSPASPHSVRRKPVPGSRSGSGNEITSNGNGNVNGSGSGNVGGYKSSLSMGSMTSFVLEDPPKGKKGLGLGLGVGL